MKNNQLTPLRQINDDLDDVDDLVSLPPSLEVVQAPYSTEATEETRPTQLLRGNMSYFIHIVQIRHRSALDYLDNRVGYQ